MPHVEAGMPDGVERIRLERQRQITVEGFTAERDDAYTQGELSIAAACFAADCTEEAIYVKNQNDEYSLDTTITFKDPWPFGSRWDKRFHPTNCLPNRISILAKAGALIAAEIDRLQRL